MTSYRRHGHSVRLLWLTSSERRLERLISPSFMAACSDLRVTPIVIDVRQANCVQIARAQDCDVAASRFAYQPLGHEAALAVEARGVPIINRSEAILLASDQLRTVKRFEEMGLPFPRSVIADSGTSPGDVVSSLGLPVVIKPPHTSGGRDLNLARTPAELRVVLASLDDDQQVLCQHFEAASAGTDVRCLVVGGHVVAAMRRKAPPSEWRANLDLGGVGEQIEPTVQQMELALAATTAVGLDIAGVDMLPLPEGDVLLELNPKPGLRICRITRVDIMRKIVQLAVTRVDCREWG